MYTTWYNFVREELQKHFTDEACRNAGFALREAPNLMSAVLHRMQAEL